MADEGGNSSFINARKIPLDGSIICDMLNLFVRCEPTIEPYEPPQFRIEQLYDVVCAECREDSRILESTGCLFALCMYYAMTPSFKDDLLRKHASMFMSIISESISFLDLSKKLSISHPMDVIDYQRYIHNPKDVLYDTFRFSLNFAREIVREVMKFVRGAREKPTSSDKGVVKLPLEIIQPHIYLFMCTFALSHIAAVLSAKNQMDLVPGIQEALVVGMCVNLGATAHMERFASVVVPNVLPTAAEGETVNKAAVRTYFLVKSMEYVGRLCCTTFQICNSYHSLFELVMILRRQQEYLANPEVEYAKLLIQNMLTFLYDENPLSDRIHAITLLFDDIRLDRHEKKMGVTIPKKPIPKPRLFDSENILSHVCPFFCSAFPQGTTAKDVAASLSLQASNSIGFAFARTKKKLKADEDDLEAKHSIHSTYFIGYDICSQDGCVMNFDHLDSKEISTLKKLRNSYRCYYLITRGLRHTHKMREYYPKEYNPRDLLEFHQEQSGTISLVGRVKSTQEYRDELDLRYFEQDHFAFPKFMNPSCGQYWIVYNILEYFLSNKDSNSLFSDEVKTRLRSELLGIEKVQENFGGLMPVNHKTAHNGAKAEKLPSIRSPMHGSDRPPTSSSGKSPPATPGKLREPTPKRDSRSASPKSGKISPSAVKFRKSTSHTGSSSSNILKSEESATSQKISGMNIKIKFTKLSSSPPSSPSLGFATERKSAESEKPSLMPGNKLQVDVAVPTTPLNWRSLSPIAKARSATPQKRVKVKKPKSSKGPLSLAEQKKLQAKNKFLDNFVNADPELNLGLNSKVVMHEEIRERVKKAGFPYSLSDKDIFTRITNLDKLTIADKLTLVGRQGRAEAALDLVSLTTASLKTSDAIMAPALVFGRVKNTVVVRHPLRLSLDEKLHSGKLISASTEIVHTLKYAPPPEDVKKYEVIIRKRGISVVWGSCWDVLEDPNPTAAFLKKIGSFCAMAPELASQQYANQIKEWQQMAILAEQQAVQLMKDLQEGEIGRLKTYKIQQMREIREHRKEMLSLSLRLKKIFELEAAERTRREAQLKKEEEEQKKKAEEKEKVKIKQIKEWKARQIQSEETRKKEGEENERKRRMNMADKDEFEEILRRIEEESNMRQCEERRRQIEKAKEEAQAKKDAETAVVRDKVRLQVDKMRERLRDGVFRHHNGELGFYDDTRHEPAPFVIYYDDNGYPYYYDTVFGTTSYDEPVGHPVLNPYQYERVQYEKQWGPGSYNQMLYEQALADNSGGYYDGDGNWQHVGFYNEKGEYIDLNLGYVDIKGRFIRHAKAAGTLDFMV